MEDGKATVRSAIDGAPAARAGVKAGDVLVEIDGAPLEGLGLNQVIDKLRGRAGTPVRLKIARKGQDGSIDVTLVREVIRRPGARIEVHVVDGGLAITAVGAWSVLDFEKGKSVPVKITANGAFRVEGGDYTRLTFVTDQAGKISGLVLNPGPWEIRAIRIN